MFPLQCPLLVNLLFCVLGYVSDHASSFSFLMWPHYPFVFKKVCKKNHCSYCWICLYTSTKARSRVRCVCIIRAVLLPRCSLFLLLSSQNNKWMFELLNHCLHTFELWVCTRMSSLSSVLWILSNMTLSFLQKATKKTDRIRPEETDVTELTDEELKDQLLKYGVNAGPVVGETTVCVHCTLYNISLRYLYNIALSDFLMYIPIGCADSGY